MNKNESHDEQTLWRQWGGNSLFIERKLQHIQTECAALWFGHQWVTGGVWEE